MSPGFLVNRPACPWARQFRPELLTRSLGSAWWQPSQRSTTRKAGPGVRWLPASPRDAPFIGRQAAWASIPAMRPARSRTKIQVLADRRAEEGVRALGAEIRVLREDAGLSKAAIARIAGIDPTHLRLIEEGHREGSASVLTRIAAALGADFSRRLFPSGGPPIRDRFQARMVEAFLRELPPDWSRSVEVAVYRPVRGVIDAVLGHPTGHVVIALECQSELVVLNSSFAGHSPSRRPCLPRRRGRP